MTPICPMLSSPPPLSPLRYLIPTTLRHPSPWHPTFYPTLTRPHSSLLHSISTPTLRYPNSPFQVHSTPFLSPLTWELSWPMTLLLAASAFLSWDSSSLLPWSEIEWSPSDRTKTATGGGRGGEDGRWRWEREREVKMGGEKGMWRGMRRRGWRREMSKKLVRWVLRMMRIW